MCTLTWLSHRKQKQTESRSPLSNLFESSDGFLGKQSWGYHTRTQVFKSTFFLLGVFFFFKTLKHSEEFWFRINCRTKLGQYGRCIYVSYFSGSLIYLLTNRRTYFLKHYVVNYALEGSGLQKFDLHLLYFGPVISLWMFFCYRLFWLFIPSSQPVLQFIY